VTGFAAVQAEPVLHAVLPLLRSEGLEPAAGSGRVDVHRVGRRRCCRSGRSRRRCRRRCRGNRRSTIIGTDVGARWFTVFLVDLEETIIETDGGFGKRLGGANSRRTINQSTLNFRLETASELGLEGLVVPFDEAGESEKLSGVGRDGPRLGEVSECLFGSTFEIGIAEIGDELLAEDAEVAEDVGIPLLEVGFDKSESLATEIADGEVNLLIVGAEQGRVSPKILSDLIEEGSAGGTILAVVGRRSFNNAS